MYEEATGGLPNYLTANTLFGLRKKMYKNRQRLGADYVKYYDINQVTSKRGLVFIAWYDSPLKTDEDFARLTTDFDKKDEVSNGDTP